MSDTKDKLLWPNGQVMASQTYIKTGANQYEPWDGSVSVSVTSSGSAIQDGVDEDIKATVIDGLTATGVANPLAVALYDDEGNPISGTGGGPVTIADGDDVTQGAIADVAVTGDNSGTLSAKLRGVNKIWADVWDSVNHRLNVFIQNSTLAVTQSGSWVISAGSAIIGTVRIDQTTPGTTNNVTVSTIASFPAPGSNIVQLGAGTAIVGKVGIDQTTPGTTNGVVVNSSALPSGASTSANQSTEITSLQLIDNPVGSLTGGTAGTSSFAAGAVYNATPPTLTDGQQASLQLTVDGKLIVTTSGGGSGGTSSDFGDPFPTVGTAVGFQDASGDMAPVVLDASGRVPVAVGSSVLPTGAATLAEQQTQTASLSVLDDWDESDRAKVNPIVGQAGVAAGTGVDGATVQRVSLATNVALPAGTNNIGDVDVLTLPAIPAGNNNIGDVDVASIVPGTGATNLGKAEDAAHTSGDVGVMALGVANAAQATFAADGDYTPLATDVKGNLSVVGNIADDSAAAGNPVRTAGIAKSPDGTDPGSVTENDVAAVSTDLNRRVFVNTNHATSKTAHLDGSSAYTDQALISDPGDGFQVIITNIIGSTGAATALNFFLEEGSTKIFGPIYLEAVAGRGFCSGPIYLPCTASTAVTITSSASIAQSFQVNYFVQAV